MSVEEKIAQIKAKAAKVAVKVATLATLATGVGVVSGCEREEKTSVVVRSEHVGYGRMTKTHMLFEDGTSIKTTDPNAEFVEPGDTVTYFKKSDAELKWDDQVAIKSVKYKQENGKIASFPKKGRGITD